VGLISVHCLAPWTLLDEPFAYFISVIFGVCIGCILMILSSVSLFDSTGSVFFSGVQSGLVGVVSKIFL